MAGPRSRVWSSKGIGHNSSGNSLKTSLIALSKDQVSILGSEPESFENFAPPHQNVYLVFPL